MANVGEFIGRTDGPTVAELLDPVALEARLVEARARRAIALAARSAKSAGLPPASAAGAAPHPVGRLRIVALPLLLAGLAAGVAIASLAPWRPAVAPEVTLNSAAALAPPALTSPAPVPPADMAGIAATPLPDLAPLALAMLPAPPALSPEPPPSRRVVAASRTRTATAASAVQAAPVLATAAVASALAMISRSLGTGGDLGAVLPFVLPHEDGPSPHPIRRHRVLHGSDKATPARNDRGSANQARATPGLVPDLGNALRRAAAGLDPFRSEGKGNAGKAADGHKTARSAERGADATTGSHGGSGKDRSSGRGGSHGKDASPGKGGSHGNGHGGGSGKDGKGGSHGNGHGGGGGKDGKDGKGGKDGKWH